MKRLDDLETNVMAKLDKESKEIKYRDLTGPEKV